MNWRSWPLVLGAVCVLVLCLLASGVAPVEALSGLVRGSFGSASAISGTLRETMPLLFAGIAVFLGLRAGLFNIGADGQLLVGACSCAIVALRIPGALGMIAGALAAILAGALWALPAGLIRAYRNGHEVITTIMLNYVAASITTALVAGPFKAAGHESPTTALLPPNQRLPMALTQPFDLSPALCLAIALTVGLAWWLTSTVRGYELRAAGANPIAATFAGIDTKAVLWRSMTLSGGIAGLGGAMLVLGSEGRFYSGFSPGYGFDALGVALLAGGSALALLPAALLFGALSKGGTSIQILGVPRGITTVVLGLVILVAAALRYRRRADG